MPSPYSAALLISGERGTVLRSSQGGITATAVCPALQGRRIQTGECVSAQISCNILYRENIIETQIINVLFSSVPDSITIEDKLIRKSFAFFHKGNGNCRVVIKEGQMYFISTSMRKVGTGEKRINLGM